MMQLVNILLFILGIIATVTGLFGIQGNPVLLAALPVGLGIMYIAHKNDANRELRAENLRSETINSRIAELTKAPWGSHQSLTAKGPSWLMLVILLMTVAGAFAVDTGTSGPEIRWQMTLIGAFFLGVSAIALSRTLPSMFQPAIKLERQGFTTPIHGLIPWKGVSGIYLQTTSHRGAKSHVLMFKVDRYRDVVTDIHWTERLLGAFGLGATGRKIVGVALSDGDEKPEAIEAVAKFLWKQVTGRDHYWCPLLPDEVNNAGRRMNEYVAKLGDEKSIEEALRRDPVKALEDLEAFSKDLTTVRTAQKRFLSQFKYATYGTVVLLLMYLLWPLLKRLLA